MISRPRAVLFDLDGTLIDSAPDLAGACNDMREARGLAPLPFEVLRRMVGAGARGMVGVGFSVAPGEPDFPELREEFLRRYEARMTQATQVFADIPPLLIQLRSERMAWGIVTNKVAPCRAARRLARIRRDRRSDRLRRHDAARQAASPALAGGGATHRRRSRRLYLRGR
jgi:phosphoglycolate phosphatase-like HAD superfamily hydrolase